METIVLVNALIQHLAIFESVRTKDEINRLRLEVLDQAAERDKDGASDNAMNKVFQVYSETVYQWTMDKAAWKDEAKREKAVKYYRVIDEWRRNDRFPKEEIEAVIVHYFRFN